MIGQDVTASYIYLDTNKSSSEIGDSYEGPFDVPYDKTWPNSKANGTSAKAEAPGAVSDPRANKDEWVLLDATPASCANIGIHHLFKHKKSPIDLVISGPNFGRNSTALYIMSSGTVGAAMEAALCGVKAIGISYAYETRNHDYDLIDIASKKSVELINHLYNNWDDGVQLYSINVPLVDTLKTEEPKIVYAHILQNLWGPAFERFEDYEERVKKGEENPQELSIGVPVRKPEDGNELETFGTVSRDERLTQFKWKPDYQAVRDSVKKSPAGNDGWAVDQGYISVTPMRACFQVVDIKGEIKLNK